ncbi:shewanella-like protein phosphatase 2 isoform X2 [Papaver somniferum]|uniref:shewanella-like protein phosphatase 2 isoform X2 n=1 Tax=Papaver somniferum TaxID=3469 RepID=UPI000E6FA6FD|nr:shewanella-like protein phosphatase 2 isoform X2 [Papaver somniferum]
MSEPATICREVPQLLTSFVDAFVDYAFSGFILPQKPKQFLTSIQTRYTSPDRLIAIGDLHGDLEKTKQSFKLAGLIDDSDRWIGGNTTVVQIGDVLDRGDDEIKILYFLEKLKHEALKSGGLIITMNGNHEIMNVDGDFRKQFHQGFRDRIAALRPNGPISGRFISGNPTILVIGDSVFVHGGLLKNHVEYGLERINNEVRDWVNGLKGRISPGYLRGRDSVVWLRRFSEEKAKNCDCSALEHVLATIPGAKRMIMGHTIQQVGINGVCENKAIRIDVGMSKGCGDGLPEVLEINRNSSELRVLTSNPAFLARKYSNPAIKTDGQKEGLGLLIPQHQPKQIEVKS